MKLSKKEQETFELLKSINKNTCWNQSIRNVIKMNNPTIFRMLICELKSQAEDDSVVMMDILGEEVYNAVINL